jgi:hypothetical protein
VDGDAGDVTGHRFDLAGVETAANGDAKRCDLPRDVHGAANGAGRAIKCDKEAVAGSFDNLPAKSHDLMARGIVMPIQ